MLGTTKTENVFTLGGFKICVDQDFHSDTTETPGQPENEKLGLLCLLITDFIKLKRCVCLPFVTLHMLFCGYEYIMCKDTYVAGLFIYVQR